MKIIVLTAELNNGVKEAMAAVSSRTTLPILTGLKLSVVDNHEDESKNGLFITGSDSDIRIQSQIPLETEDKEIVTVEKAGAIVLPSKFFSEIVKKMPGEFTTISVGDNFQTTISSGSAEFILNGFDPEEYPKEPEVEGKTVKIASNLLKGSISNTTFAVSTSETRPILTGVNWTVADGKLTAVSTDSHRLSRKEITIDENANFSAVIPGKTLSELNKLLPDSDTEVEMVMANNHVLFKTAHTLFFSRLLDGNYPETSRLIPTEEKTTILVNKNELRGAIDRCGLFARDSRNHVIKVSMSPGESSSMKIEATSDVGKVEEVVSLESLSGEELKISFSAKYAMDALKALDGDVVKLTFTGSMRPFLVRSESDSTILQLILPVRTY